MKSKYGVSGGRSGREKRTCDGIVFASIAEMEYYILLNEKNICFEMQPSFVLQEGFKSEYGKIRDIRYVADFRIGKYVVDVKGMETPEFRLKKKMFLKLNSDLVLVLAKKSGKNWKHYEYEIKQNRAINFFERLSNEL